MPKPRKGESKSDFISRCIPDVMGEGRSQSEAQGRCYGIWEHETKEGKVSLKDKIIAAVESIFKSTEPTVNPGFNLYKATDGGWRWFAIFSNKYRDNDNPPEILSEAAHLDFVKAVDSGEWPKPELWLWHIPGTKWGTTEFVAYDKANGLSLAAGRVDKGKEKVAEALNSMPSEEVGVSHGMPKGEILRDPDDQSILTRYRSKEFSPLSWDAAANKLTIFSGVKEMELESKQKEDQLREWLGEDRFKVVDELMELKGKEARDANLEFKETEEANEEATEEETQIEEAPDEPGESKDKEVDPVLTKEEVADAIAFMTENLTKAFNDVVTPLVEKVAELESEVAELKATDEEKVAKMAAETPRASGASLRDIVASRVIGNESARIDGRTKEAQGPKETEVRKEFTGNPIMDSAFANIEKMWQGGMTIGRNPLEGYND